MGKIGEDFATFARVISSALLLCGFIVLGVVGGRALVQRGYPEWMLHAATILGTLFGAWQAWVYLKMGIKNRKS